MFGTRQLGQRWETYRPTKALVVWSCAACIIATDRGRLHLGWLGDGRHGALDG